MSKVLAFSPAPSYIGYGALALLPELLERRGWRQVFLVTDSVLAANGLLDRVLGLLTGVVEVEVFEDVPAEPRAEDVESIEPRECPDVLLGLGGGSAMDFAKGLSVQLTHGGFMADYVGEGRVPGPVLPVVCVPTTAGTGSQATQTAVFTVDGVKRGVSAEEIRPALSVVDPELTISLPRAVTRNSGYDALMHAVESFLARPFEDVPERPIHYQGSNPFSRSLSLEAFRTIWGAYERAVSHGSDREARAAMAMGSHLAGIAFSHSGLGLVHALASSLGGMIDAPHGICLAACTDIGMRYNAAACREGLEILGRVAEGGPSGFTEDAPPKFLTTLQQLLQRLNFPTRPSQLGITRADAEALLSKTLLQTRRLPTNPRAIGEELLVAIQEGI